MRGVRQRRPSENVNEHKDTRSFGLREDLTVSLELSFGIAYREKPADAFPGKPAVQNRNASRGREAQYRTKILYHNGNTRQVNKLGTKERKVKIRSLKNRRLRHPTNVRATRLPILP